LKLNFTQFSSSILALLFVYCSTWKKSSLGVEASWFNSEEFLVYSIEFEETNSWNPLEGTTIKRNFSTRLREYKLKPNNELEQISEFQFPFWILNNNIFYNARNKNIFMMRGSSEGYGTAERTISNYLISEKKIIDIWKGKPGEFLWKILPSPDSSQIAFITTGSHTSEFEAKLHIWNGNEIRSINLPSWIDASFEYGISWNIDSKILYLAIKNEVYSLNTSSKELVLTKATQFPKCFVPSTSFGFRISPDGKYVEGHSLTNQFQVSKKQDFIEYFKIPKTNTYQNQKCSFAF